jgi:protein O-mannosyl-transferase
MKAISIIIVVGIIVFSNSLVNGFVGDDFGQLVENQYVRSLANIPSFFAGSTFDYGNGMTGIYFRPMVLTVFTVMRAIFGLRPFFFHLLQLTVFIANAILVWIILARFFSKNLALGLALVFLVHPLNQDSAAMIANFQEVGFLFCGLAGLYITITNKTRWASLKTFGFLGLSLLFKESGLALVAINLVYVGLMSRERLKKTFLASVILVTVFELVRYHAVGWGFVTTHNYHLARLPLALRLLSMPKIITYYFSTFVFPKDLAINYDWVVTKTTLGNFVLPLLIVLFLVGLTWWGSKRNRNFLFFAIWFWIGLGLHVQIIPLDATVAPHWFYFPIVGLLGILGQVAQQIKYKKAYTYLFILGLGLLSVRTIVRNTNFMDNLTLMCHDADLTHDNFALENSCASGLLRVMKYDEAQKHAELSVKLAPYYGANWLVLGTIYGGQAEKDKNRETFKLAEAAINKAVEINPDSPWAVEVMGYLYAYHKDFGVAKKYIEEALNKFPDDYKLWLYLSITEYHAGDVVLATAAVKKAYALNPEDVIVSKLYYGLVNNLEIKMGDKFFSL